MQISPIEIVGYIGAGFALATFAMKTIIPLRIFGMASNVTFLVYGYAHEIYPTLIVNGIVLPLNAWRLYEMLQLTRQVQAAADCDLSFEWLKPFMTKRQVRCGDLIFRRGDAACELFFTVSGLFRLKEIEVEIGPGQLVGELGLLAPENKRTQTFECLEDGEIQSVTYKHIRRLYYQNPKFGFYFLRLASERLFQNLERLEREVEASKSAGRLSAPATAPDRDRAEGRPALAAGQLHS